MTTIDCECSEEFGPCEQHGEQLAQREGASTRTGDELTMVLIDDLQSVGAELSVWGKQELTRLESALEASRDPVSGCAWFNDPDDADAAVSLADQLEAYVADLWVIHDDGYRIVRPSKDCPLLDL